MHKIKFFSKHFLWLIWRFIELSLAFLIVAFILAFWYLASKPADVKLIYLIEVIKILHLPVWKQDTKMPK